MSDQLSTTEQAFNQLVVTCATQYGRVHETLEQATPATIGQYRARDLFILRSTAQHIGQMSDPNAALCLSTLGTHMNTFEGAVACFNMIAERFPAQAEMPTSFKTDIEGMYRDKWVAKFGYTPIRPEEYGAASVAPALHPLPRATHH